MRQAEYIVRFKGDYSALAKDMAKINAATTKLEDDEVIIKLNYDGNIKEFNKVFDQISKMHPELGIQFQYNVNEKMLNQEIDKLNQLTEIKLDVKEGNVQGKLEALADNIEASLKRGLSKEDISRQLREFFGYYNTSIKAGAKEIDLRAVDNRISKIFETQKNEIREIYDNVWLENDRKKIQLFNIDKSVDEDISATQTRVNDLKDTLASLEKQGASKSGLPSELQKVQDEIKILRSDINEMQGQLKNLSGDAFDNMTEQIKNTNKQLELSLQMVSDLKASLKTNGIKQDTSIGGIVKQWQDEEVTKSRERYTAFNSQTKKSSGAHVAADAEGVSMKLMRSAIEELGDEADGTIHSHPQKYAAFSDDDMQLYYKLFQEGISKQIVTSSQEAISLDMTKVDIDKGDEVIDLIKSRYKEIDDKFLNNLQLSTAEITEAVTPILNAKTKNPIVDAVIRTIRENYTDLVDGVMNLEEFSKVIETNADYILKQIPEFKQLSTPDRSSVVQTIAGWSDLLHDAVLGGISENVQREYQDVLQEVFTNPTFLKAGETSAIKIQTLADFIDWGSVTESAEEAAHKAANALQEAQDSNSPAELTKPLGNNFTEGYAEGIREAIPDVVKACKEVVLAAYNAIKEAKTSEDGESVDFSEGFINSFKESLDRAVPTIQEKIKEVFSKINIGDENSSMFEGIGQEIIDSIIVGLKNAHSGESFTASLESIINNAFTQVALDSAARDFLVQIQTTMDTQGNLRLKYFSVDTDSIIFEIQNGLDNNSFNINLGGTIQDLATTLNTSADNVRLSFIDAIKWMQQANEWQKVNKDIVAKVVDDEIDYFKVLEDSVNGVTTAIEKQYDTTKNAKPKSEESKKKSSGNKSSEPDRDELLRQHKTELWKNYFQSIGQKSQIQQDMSEYYAQLEKDSAKAYSDAEKKASSLLDKVKKLQSSNKYTQDFKNDLNTAETELRTFLDNLTSGTISFDQLDGKVKELSDNIEGTLARKAFGSVKQAAEKSLTNVGLKIDQIIAKNSAMGKDFESRFKTLRNRLDGATSVEEVQKIIAEVNRLESELISTGNTGKSFIDQIKQRLRDINSKYIAQYFSFQDIIRYARQAATNVIQLNDAFIELSKVSNTSLETLEKDFQSYADIAHDIGGTITDTINATADWARMGYSVPDSKQLAEVAMLYKNVGDGISIDDANSSLISTLQGYQMQADEAEHIVDVFNEVANNYAIDTAGIGEALQRSAASLNAANTSLEQSVALVTAANTVVQNPESVGTTFKTNLYVFMYSNVHIEYI